MIDKVIGLSEVPGLIKNGSSIFVGGFSMYRVPLGMIREIARSGLRDLTLISHIDGSATEMLLAVGALSTIRSSYVGLDLVGLAPLFTEAVKNGTVRFTEETEGTMMFGMKATIYRLPYMPSRGLVGTDLTKIRPDLREYDCPLTGERLVAIPPVTADVALIHAQRADAQGNVQIEGTLSVDLEAVKVAGKVIVSVEKLVSHAEILAAPDTTRIPSYLVDAVVPLPLGAYPSSCVPFYDVDLGYFLEYTEMVAGGRLSEYVAKHIHSEPFAEYVRKRVGSAE